MLSHMEEEGSMVPPEAGSMPLLGEGVDLMPLLGVGVTIITITIMEEVCLLVGLEGSMLHLVEVEEEGSMLPLEGLEGLMLPPEEEVDSIDLLETLKNNLIINTVITNEIYN